MGWYRAGGGGKSEGAISNYFTSIIEAENLVNLYRNSTLTQLNLIIGPNIINAANLCQSTPLTDLSIKFMNNSKLQDLSYAFYSGTMKNLKIEGLNNNIKNITNLAYVFAGQNSLISLEGNFDFSNSNYSNLNNVSGMFSGQNNNFGPSKISFNNCFNLTDISSMFSRTSFYSNVYFANTNLKRISYAFQDCSNKNIYIPSTYFLDARGAFYNFASNLFIIGNYGDKNLYFDNASCQHLMNGQIEINRFNDINQQVFKNSCNLYESLYFNSTTLNPELKIVLDNIKNTNLTIHYQQTAGNSPFSDIIFKNMSLGANQYEQKLRVFNGNSAKMRNYYLNMTYENCNFLNYNTSYVQNGYMPFYNITSSNVYFEGDLTFKNININCSTSSSYFPNTNTFVNFNSIIKNLSFINYKLMDSNAYTAFNTYSYGCKTIENIYIDNCKATNLRGPIFHFFSPSSNFNIYVNNIAVNDYQQYLIELGSFDQDTNIYFYNNLKINNSLFYLNNTLGSKIGNLNIYFSNVENVFKDNLANNFISSYQPGYNLKISIFSNNINVFKNAYNLHYNSGSKIIQTDMENGCYNSGYNIYLYNNYNG